MYITPTGVLGRFQCNFSLPWRRRPPLPVDIPLCPKGWGSSVSLSKPTSRNNWIVMNMLPHRKSHSGCGYFSTLLPYKWKRRDFWAGVCTLHSGTCIYFTNWHILASSITSFHSKTFCFCIFTVTLVLILMTWILTTYEKHLVRTVVGYVHAFSEILNFFLSNQIVWSFMIGKTPFLSAYFVYLRIKNNHAALSSD